MILLSFDIEEFDMPIEYGQPITFEEQLTISTNGILLILDLLKSFNAKATFFCTANYALNRPIIISEIINEGHEIGSHGYNHSDFKIEHLLSSKIALEKIIGLKVIGFRMPKMMRVNEYEIQKAGYIYNSSLNPTFIPGRYNNLNKPRSWFYEYGILQLPASVSSYLRFPLFWLTFHHVPLFVIKECARQPIKGMVI
ncbi:polysaccharide deacetylase family protein [Mucilaginibacter corticis]|uniref:polysaccharide deacetylase family protein n=1 Tax=Mucilaginibacter corticis TaxID=2597670 RepID=UPI001FE95A48|nr:polysaccharide deacetylase family protein [Mucilaginibacter corticis]